MLTLLYLCSVYKVFDTSQAGRNDHVGRKQGIDKHWTMSYGLLGRWEAIVCTDEFYKSPRRFLGGLIEFATGDWCTLFRLHFHLCRWVGVYKSISQTETTCCLRSFGILMALIYQLMKIPKLCRQHTVESTSQNFPPLRNIFLQGFSLLYDRDPSASNRSQITCLDFCDTCSSMEDVLQCSPPPHISHQSNTCQSHLRPTCSPTTIRMDFNETLTDCPCLPCWTY